MDLGLGRRAHAIAAAAGLVAAVLAALLLAAAASAEVRSGTATDGVEPERLRPGQDIVAASASYDTTAGTIRAAVTTLGPPLASEKMALGVAFGVLQGGECVSPMALVLGLYESPTTAAWASDTGEGPASKSVAGSTTTMTASGAALANQPYDCVQAIVFEVVNEGESLESIEGLATPMPLTAPPPPPPPPSSPPPSSPPPATTPPPAPQPQAKLSLAASKPLTLRRGKWKQVKLKVRNGGDATAAKVSLRLGRAKGVAVKPKSGKLKLKSIAPGKSKTASFKLLLTKKAKATSKLALKLTGAKGVKASGTLTLEAWKKSRPHTGDKGKGKEPTAPERSPLAEKLFYAYEMQASESATLIGYAFLDDTWAYHGIPAGGLPTCTEVTGSADKEGCVKYSYDPKTGAVTIGSLGGGKITSRGALEIDGQAYSPTYIPPAGTRYQVEQEYITYYGLCGLITGCSTSHHRVLLTNGGEFVLTSESLTTVGGSGPGETFVAAGSYPPDQHGTYAIEPRGRIKLSFADGTVQTKTIAVLLNSAGNPDPVNEGFLLDSDYFTFLPDD